MNGEHMNKGMNFPCIVNVHFSSTSTEAALLVNRDLKSIHSVIKFAHPIIH
jgi:hypothetical protein